MSRSGRTWSAIAAVALTAGLVAVVPTAAQGSTDEVAAVLREIEAGRVEEAERRLAELARTASYDPRVHDLLGVLASRAGRYGEAEAHYRRALELDPTLAVARAHLARLYLLAGREEEALDELRRAAATPGGPPLDRDLALRLAAAELVAGRHAAAEAQLGSLAERHESPQALLLLARLHVARGDLDAALGSLGEARALAPNARAVLDAEARVAFAAGALPRALSALDALARMHPSELEYNYRLGIAQLRIGDHRSAIGTLERARDLEPGRVAVQVALGLALNARNGYLEAVDAFEAALRLDPSNALALGGLSEAELGLGRIEEAERLATRALELDPEQATPLLALGMIRLQQGRFEEAREALVRAIAADPERDKAHYQLSLAYARLGEPERSREELEIYQRLRAVKDAAGAEDDP